MEIGDVWRGESPFCHMRSNGPATPTRSSSAAKRKNAPRRLGRLSTSNPPGSRCRRAGGQRGTRIRKVLEHVIEHDDVEAHRGRQRIRKKPGPIHRGPCLTRSPDRRVGLDAVNVVAAPRRRVQEPAVCAAHLEQRPAHRHRVDAIEDPLEVFPAKVDQRMLPRHFVENACGTFVADMGGEIRRQVPALGTNEAPVVAPSAHARIAHRASAGQGQGRHARGSAAQRVDAKRAGVEIIPARRSAARTSGARAIKARR